jgi:two-component system LytT family response regulator
MDVLIVDDEIAVRRTIAGFIKESFPDLIVVATAGSVNEALTAIDRFHPQLVFLDVELPDGTGFDLLEKVPEVGFRVVFVTGHHEYALAAIKVSALDYILKPVDPDELSAAIQKARKNINHNEEKLKIDTLSENIQGRQILKRIILSTAENLHVVRIDDIVRAEADSNYTTFWLTDGRHIMVSRTIKEFDMLLAGSGMIRVHQSHLVNLAAIDKFVKRDGGYLLMKDGSSIPVSQNLKKGVLGAIRNFLYE